MIRFIIAYILIYGSVHGVFFHRLRLAFPFKGWVTLVILLLLVVVILSPIFSRMLESRGDDASARIVAFISYYWMGFIFYAFLGCMCLYLIDFLSWVLSLFHISFLLVSPKAQFVGLMGLVLAIMIYGHYEAWHIKTERFEIATDKLPPSIASIRVVQISDIHLGIISRDKFLRRVLEKVKAESPDIFVCTGDLVDGSMVNLMHLADFLSEIKAPYGKFAVTGNHEYYAGLDHALAFMEKAGFDILRGQKKTIDDIINVAGIDDGGRNSTPDAFSTLSKFENPLFTLYLVHRPDISKKVMGLYDLQLCGHTHNGQIFPFTYMVSLAFPLLKGFHEMESGSRLYISRGTGTWGPPIRVLSSPEISVFDIRKK